MMLDHGASHFEVTDENLLEVIFSPPFARCLCVPFGSIKLAEF